MNYKIKLDSPREEALFQAAAQLTGIERVAFLKGACHGDTAMLARLNARPVAQEESNGVGDAPAGVGGPTIKLELKEIPDEAVGQTLGRYKLLERVGEGGCGVVYVAEQTEPVRRRVALKVIKLGMDTKQVVARFEAERQALAMMDHPNIAKVLDAGTTDVGRPFFVMELVRGIRITDYCDQANLTTKERLDLFIKVCQAIQHAHQKGIIHRDIKPSNILVTLHDGVPVPKVIDFGIAKATEGRLTDNTVYTQLHQFIGTPAYMSPEQAEMSGLDIDTRSDIYSLGVLLYELLAGSTPFDATELMASGIDAMRKTIREKEPPRPSTKLSQTLVAAAKVGRVAPRAPSSGERTSTGGAHGVTRPTTQSEEEIRASSRRLLRIKETITLLKGDLDWIVMKCLEKDRTRRYDTANGLAMDIKRHLNNEPVLARPPSRLYEFQKTVRRHKFGFAAAATLITVLAIGVLISTWQAAQATRAKREALAAEAQATTQREKAEASEQKAIAAQANETILREQAQAEEFAARQRAYASDMNVAKQQLDGNNLGRALDLLNRQRPQPGQKDLRGWEWRYLWQQTRSDALFTLCQESSEIYSLAVSPDGIWLAVGVFHQGGLAVWDVRTRQELIRLAKNEQIVRAVFSPTEPLLAFASSALDASGERRTTLRLWNTATRQTTAEMPLDERCSGLAFAKDGRTLVTSTVGGNTTLWRMPDGTKLASHTSTQASLDYRDTFAATPDLKLAAETLTGGRVSILDLRGGRELWTAVATKQFLKALAFSPDGKTMASAAGYTESDIRLWEVATGKQVGKLEGHGSWVSSLVFTPDGKRLISSSADQTIRIWDAASQKCLDVLRGHRQEVWRLALLPDGKTLVSGGKDGTVCFWDMSVRHPHDPRTTIPAENVANWNFASDGRSLLTQDRQGQVAQWSGGDLQMKSPLLELGTGFSPSCFSRDGRFLAFCRTNGSIQVWDLSQRVLLHQFSNTTDRVEAPAFLGDGKKLISWSKSGNWLHEWDLTTGLEIQSWQPPAGFFATALTPDERSLLAIGGEGDVIFRNLVDESQTKLKLDVLETDVGSYSPDGKRFAVASSLGFARVWDTATWKPVATLGGFLNGVHGENFSPDGKRLAIASGGREAVRLCDTDSWQDVLTLESQGSGFGGVGFSPDGNALIWGSQTTLSLWRAPSWAEINAAGATDKTEIRQP